MFCSNCGKQIKDGSVFCLYCGANQTAAQQPAQPPVFERPTQPQRQQPTQPQWQQPAQPQWQQPTGAPQPSAPAPKQKSGNKPLVIVISVLLALLLIGGGVIAWIIFNNKDDGEEEKSRSGRSSGDVTEEPYTAPGATSGPTSGNNIETPTEEITETPNGETAKTDEPSAAVITTIRLATVTPLLDTGLLSYLLPVFEAQTGYTVEIYSAGTGITFAYGKSGDADLILAPDGKQAEAFIEEGYAVANVPFAYGYDIIVGPTEDPAGINNCSSAANCFKAISNAKAPFFSRGDSSSINNKEIGIWEAAQIDPNNESWYTVTGTGMGDALQQANDNNAYILTDKCTFFALRNQLSNLSVLTDTPQDLAFTYTLITINPNAAGFAENNITLNSVGAQALADWLLSDEAAVLIERYGIEEYGEAIFSVRN